MRPVTHSSVRRTLREITVDDVDALHAIHGSAEVTRHLSFESRTRDQVGVIVARAVVAATVRPRSEYALAVTGRADGRLIGFARLATEPQRAATVGFALHPGHWGRGYGTDVVRALLVLGFDGLGTHRVWAARSPTTRRRARSCSAWAWRRRTASATTCKYAAPGATRSSTPCWNTSTERAGTPSPGDRSRPAGRR
ncbi:GNAT family N-acetyltransferase [Streptomyces sp. RFCAC02]|uniref:GNAT family N-acetyltransferase n=1 Tax=Streptomyces sp. RFCAC02 TaxID=2499143 RepID=UPI00320812A4